MTLGIERGAIRAVEHGGDGRGGLASGRAAEDENAGPRAGPDRRAGTGGAATGPSGAAVVIGGTAGVGRAVAEALVERGYLVGVVARGKDRLREMQHAHRGRVHTAAADAGDAAALDAAVDSLVAAIGTPRVWVNSAMLTSFSPFERMSPEEFDTIVRVTFLGQVNGTRAAIRLMPRGNIVNIGSGLSYRAVPFQSAHCAAKHAVNGFSSALRSELKRDGHPLEISLVQLPALNTPQFDWARNRLEKRPRPMPPVFQPEVAAKAVLRAIDGNVRELFVGKSVMQMVFGEMVLPAWLDRKLSEVGVEMQKSSRDETGNRQDNIEAPVPRRGTARGSFGKRAREDATIIDGDNARKLVFFGIPLLTFVAGIIVG